MPILLVPLQMIRRKLKYLVIFTILTLIMIKTYDYGFNTPYPFEENQLGVNSLLTDEELKKVFQKSYLYENKCSNEAKVLVAINSATLNFRKRQIIRETWGKWVQNTNQSYLFFVSKPTDRNIEKEIELENYYYGDIVQVPTRESYYLLSFKILSSFFWTTNYCSKIKFYIKCDDDMFLNWKNLYDFLLSKENETNVIYGSVKRSYRPNRDFTSRWYVSFKDYEEKRYPDFAGKFEYFFSQCDNVLTFQFVILDGPVYIMTYDLIPKLLNTTSLVKPFYLEDVYITGMLREKIREARILSLKNLIGSYIIEKSYCHYNSSYSFHKIGSDQMKFLFDKYSFAKTNSSLICSFLENFKLFNDLAS